MLSTLNDPYTRFLTPEQFESLTMTMTTTPSKSSSGIGVQLIGGKTGVIIANTIPNSPAEKNGILVGDVIRSVDGIDMVGATAEAVAAKCRGDIGTTVELEIERPTTGGSSNVQKVVVTRTALPTIPVVESSILTKGSVQVAVLKINSFTQETESKVEEQLKRFIENTKPSLSAVVLDLRGNVGGYMPAGVDVAKLFLPPRARIISVRF
jgi:carboxyl-terminal processing protease